MSLFQRKAMENTMETQYHGPASCCLINNPKNLFQQLFLQTPFLGGAAPDPPDRVDAPPQCGVVMLPYTILLGRG